VKKEATIPPERAHLTATELADALAAEVDGCPYLVDDDD
jgi:hypothetical protein